MNDQKVTVSLDAYFNYIEAMLRMCLLRELLYEVPEYYWGTIIRKVLDIPKEDEKNEP